ncbi:MAG: TIGR03118 family protein [Actinobacteria bacterium]|nr:MAG: TIGR03118 family protein [Actinomycetota bacterium]
MQRRLVSLFLLAPLLALISTGSALATRSNSTGQRQAVLDDGYRVKNLVSDVPGQAAHVDPNLVNAWGLVAGPTTPWWVADNGTNVSTLYTGAGDVLSLVVQVDGAPTGIVFNGHDDFIISDGTNSGPAVFMFATESGTIRGWNPSVPPPPPSTQSFIAVDRSDIGAIYKGLAIATTHRGDFLYATDFHNARVDMFDSNFKLVTPHGAFRDPRIPDRYAPFGIQNIRGILFVTYAKQDADKEDDVPGPGHGFVDMFSTSGRFLGRVATRHELNSPWGLALAPESFGSFGGDLLIGNFGDGRINAYEPERGENFDHEGTLRRPSGRVIVIDGLWALQFGNGGPAGPKGTLFFTAGPDDEMHGLFGRIKPAR